MNYTLYLRNEIFIRFIGVIVWTSMTSFTIVNKSMIGVENIPIFEIIIFLFTLIGSKIAASKIISLKNALLFEAIFELIAFTFLIIALLKYDVSIESGIILYFYLIVIMTAVIITNERYRNYEDEHMLNQSSKRFLKIIRLRNRNFAIYGGIIGSCFSLLLLTYFTIELKYFAIVLIILNMLQNVASIVLVGKYL